MNIAIITEQVDARRGGAETSTIEMARRLAEPGPRVTIITCGPHAERRELAERVENRVLAARGLGKTARTSAYLRDAADAAREGAYDIVHAIIPCDTCDVYQPRGGTYAETIRRSVALAGDGASGWLRRIGRSFNMRQRRLLAAEQRMLSRAQPPVVAAVSDYVRRQTLEAVPTLPPDRVQVIFNGVDIQPLSDAERDRLRETTRAALGISPERPTLLFVAHNFKLKGLRELLLALSVVAASEATPLLLVAGRDRIEPVQRLAERLGLSPTGAPNVAHLNPSTRVRFLGPSTDIRALYAASDCLAHPTWYDPCSRVVLESLACGLPVVTTRFNGASEIMTPGVHGTIIDDPADTSALARALCAALSPDVRIRCLTDRESIRERVSMARHARELLELYERILTSKPSATTRQAPGAHRAESNSSPRKNP